jgi:hypothetical protein
MVVKSINKKLFVQKNYFIIKILSIDDNKSDRKIEFCLYKKYPAYPDFLDVQVKSFQDFFN